MRDIICNALQEQVTYCQKVLKDELESTKENQDKIIVKTLVLIKAELKARLPKEKIMPSHYDLCVLPSEDRATEEGEINGFNNCISQLHKIIEGI